MNDFSAHKNGKEILVRDGYACFQALYHLGKQKNNAKVSYFCPKIPSFQKQTNWFLECLKEWIGDYFVVEKEDDKEIIFNVKLSNCWGRDLTILTLLRYLDNNEVEEYGGTEDILRIAYKQKENFGNFEAFILGHLMTSHEGHGHVVIPTFGYFENWPGYGTFYKVPKLNVILQKIKDCKIKTVHGYFTGDDRINNLTECFRTLHKDVKAGYDLFFEK